MIRQVASVSASSASRAERSACSACAPANPAGVALDPGQDLVGVGLIVSFLLVLAEAQPLSAVGQGLGVVAKAVVGDGAVGQRTDPAGQRPVLQRDYGLLADGAEVHRPGARVRLNAAEQPELHAQPLRSPCPAMARPTLKDPLSPENSRFLQGRRTVRLAGWDHGRARKRPGRHTAREHSNGPGIGRHYSVSTGV